MALVAAQVEAVDGRAVWAVLELQIKVLLEVMVGVSQQVFLRAAAAVLVQWAGTAQREATAVTAVLALHHPLRVRP
jgi:hypothetical protein